MKFLFFYRSAKSIQAADWKTFYDSARFLIQKVNFYGSGRQADHWSKNIFSDIGAEKNKIAPKSQPFSLRTPFWSKKLTSVARTGKLIIDHKTFLKGFYFFYSYTGRSEKLIIDLKKFISIRM